MDKKNEEKKDILVLNEGVDRDSTCNGLLACCPGGIDLFLRGE